MISWQRLSFLAFGLALTLSSSLATFAAEPSDWVLLGDLHVSDRAEHDSLNVGIKKGTFVAIQIRVEGRAVQFHDVTIHFENGDVQDVPMRSVIRAGGRSRVIDLEGGRRAIDRIVFFYDAQTRRRHKGARVEVYGRQ